MVEAVDAFLLVAGRMNSLVTLPSPYKPVDAAVAGVAGVAPDVDAAVADGLGEED